MHMADALISPIVGGTMWVAAGAVAAYSIKKIKDEVDEKKIPLMGVLGAFIFTAQMINFTIPATGSSGHLGGGLILAILLGPYAGFLTIASVLTIQALFFADGGLLALGCNIINMGLFSCFIAYPLIYRVIMKKGYSTRRILVASIITAIIGLQMGAFGVVLETLFSGKTELPFGTFVLLMQPIHFAIGAVEGLVTAAIVTYIWKSRPEIIEKAAAGEALGNLSIKTAVTAELEAPDGLHQSLAALQTKTAFLPGYSFRVSENAAEESAGDAEEAWPAVSGGKSTAGLVGGGMTLVLAGLVGAGISLAKRKKNTTQA